MDNGKLITDSLSTTDGETVLASLRKELFADYSFTDVEAMGFDPLRNGLLTMSQFVTDHNYEILDEFHGKFRPIGKKEICWSDKAQDVHGITWEEAMEFPPAKQTCEELLHFWSKIKPHTFVAHNMAYDRRMIRGTLSLFDLHFPFYQMFPHFQDTIKLVKEAGLITGKSRSLGPICKELGIEHNHHDARSDAKVLIEIHKRCTQALSKETVLSLSESGEQTAGPRPAKEYA